MKMKMKMKINFTLIVLSLAIMQPVHADIISDSEQIMNDAQTVYPDLFPSKQATQTLAPYQYRFYPSTGIYLGINQDDAGVYLLGGSFGDTPRFLDKTGKVISMLKAQMGDASDIYSRVSATDSSPIIIKNISPRWEEDVTHFMGLNNEDQVKERIPANADCEKFGHPILFHSKLADNDLDGDTYWSNQGPDVSGSLCTLIDYKNNTGYRRGNINIVLYNK